MSAREQRTHLPCLLHAPGKVSKASWVFLQSQKAPVRETIVSHAGNAASVPNRKEGRTSGDATGKVGQRRASSRHDAAGWRGFGKPPLPHWRWCLTCSRHEIATIATRLTAAGRRRGETRTTAGVGCRYGGQV